MEEIEIPEISEKLGKTTEAETKKQVKSVPISTLFLKFSNNKERACLITGFICWCHSLCMTGSCLDFRNADSYILCVFWKAVG